MLFQKWWFIRSVLKYGSPCIAPMERKSIHKLGKQDPEHPCLFIIGPPRSGSTIIYQLISSLLDISYVDNLANLARENPYFGSRLSQRIFGSRSHSSFSSEYGQTTRGGLHAPAEALFFYKWFPHDRHYTEASDLNQTQKSEFANTLRAMINRAGKTLIIKNLSFSVRLQALKDILPDARYIVVRRDPLLTCQSILIGRKKTGHPENKVWGILPKDYQELEGLDPLEMVVRQVNQIERQIHEDLKNISSDHVLYIDYEQLDSGLEKTLDKITTLCGPGINRKPGIPLPDIRVKSEISLPEAEIGILKNHIQSLDWEWRNN